MARIDVCVQRLASRQSVYSVRLQIIGQRGTHLDKGSPIGWTGTRNFDNLSRVIGYSVTIACSSWISTWLNTKLWDEWWINISFHGNTGDRDYDRECGQNCGDELHLLREVIVPVFEISPITRFQEIKMTEIPDLRRSKMNVYFKKARRKRSTQLRNKRPGRIEGREPLLTTLL